MQSIVASIECKRCAGKKAPWTLPIVLIGRAEGIVFLEAWAGISIAGQCGTGNRIQAQRSQGGDTARAADAAVLTVETPENPIFVKAVK